MTSRVLIAGGGIGGLAAALALQRAGIDAVVLERAERLRDGGAGVHLWTNGMLALDQLGVARQVLAAGRAQKYCHFSTWHGRPLGAWPVGEFAHRYGQPTIAVRRSALHGILRAALDPGSVRTTAHVTGFAQDAAGVTVHLADGGTERGAVLVGADGLHSAVRRALLGDRPPRFAGYVTWRGMAHTPRDLLPPGTFHLLIGPGTRFTYYDVAPGLVNWESTANAPAGGRDAPGVRDRIAARHRDWPHPVPELIAATPETAIMRHDAVDRRPDRRWGTGRATLLGDAAHPMTYNIGQGVCQALEDAVILAEHLSVSPVDPEPALRAYERDRRARTAPLQRLARRLGRLYAMEHPLAVHAREAAMRRLWPDRVFAAAERDQLAYPTHRWPTDTPRPPTPTRTPETTPHH